MFMTEDELAELTGYKRKADQASWLKANSYPFNLDKDDRPKVLRAVVLARLGGQAQNPQSPRLRLP